MIYTAPVILFWLAAIYTTPFFKDVPSPIRGTCPWNLIHRRRTEQAFNKHVTGMATGCSDRRWKESCGSILGVRPRVWCCFLLNLSNHPRKLRTWEATSLSRLLNTSEWILDLFCRNNFVSSPISLMIQWFAWFHDLISGVSSDCQALCEVHGWMVHQEIHIGSSKTVISELTFPKPHLPVLI